MARQPLLAILITVILAMPACGGSAGETEVREHTFAVSGSPRLEVEIANGSVTVQGSGEPGEVHVRSSLRNPDEVEYSAGQDGNTVLVVGSVLGVINLFGGGAGIDTTITVPPDTELDLTTSNGGIEVDGAAGRVSVRTSNGPVSLTDVAGDIDARTSNGSIQVQGSTGRVEGRTSNGGIEVTGTLPPGSQNILETSNGDVMVTLVDTPGVDLEAVSSNGTVTSEREVSTTEDPTQEELVGTIGSGGRSLLIETSNGSITIK